MRRRFFPPDKITLTTRTMRNNAERIFVVRASEDGKIYRCKFRMSEPLKGLKDVFPNNVYVSNIVDSLLSYAGE